MLCKEFIELLLEATNPNAMILKEKQDRGRFHQYASQTTTDLGLMMRIGKEDINVKLKVPDTEISQKFLDLCIILNNPEFVSVAKSNIGVVLDNFIKTHPAITFKTEEVVFS
jgi:hypothetical protein